VSSAIERDTLFVALTRPQIFAGVTYSFFVANLIIGTELYLVFRTAWVLLAAACIHVLGVILCLKEPRIFDLWVARAANCPRVRNFRVWGCNSYRP
jgi:type IV secretion system protein VirB3